MTESWLPRDRETVMAAWDEKTPDDLRDWQSAMWGILPVHRYMSPFAPEASWTNGRGLWRLYLELRMGMGTDVVRVSLHEQTWVLEDFRVDYVLTVLRVLGAVE